MVLKALTIWLPVSALVLAVGSVLAIRFLLRADVLTDRTLAICNANRHVGLALLLTGHFLQAQRALPAVAAYALIAPLVMAATSKWFHHGERAAGSRDGVMQSGLARGTIERCSRARYVWSMKKAGERKPCPLKWLDSFSMRNFTNDQVFDDTIPMGDGLMEIGTRVPLERLQASMEDWFRRKGYLAKEAKLVVSG